MVAHKLILTHGGEEHIHEFGDIEEAFNAAVPWIMKGYVARITDKQGDVKYTQALVSGQIVTYPGDATAQAADSVNADVGSIADPWAEKAMVAVMVARAKPTGLSNFNDLAGGARSSADR